MMKKDNSDIEIGSLGKIEFLRGIYAYVGSAMNGLENRVGRHLNKKNKKFWHIDYFLGYPKVSIVQIYYKKSIKKDECKVAEKVSKYGEPVKGFGCSDCKCQSHLFRINKKFNPKKWPYWKIY